LVVHQFSPFTQPVQHLIRTQPEVVIFSNNKKAHLLGWALGLQKLSLLFTLYFAHLSFGDDELNDDDECGQNLTYHLFP